MFSKNLIKNQIKAYPQYSAESFDNVVSLNTAIELCHNKPFYFEIPDTEHNGTDCCFNHIIGLPRNNKIHGQLNKLFDYQHNIFNTLKTHKRLWILKATGLGISEFFLRYIAWLALRNDDYKNSQAVIVTGPNINLAIKLIRRMKNLFYNKLEITFDSKETFMSLNGCSIEAYPSNHIDSFRSLDNPKFILLDECDFFRKSEQQDVRAVAERYIGKSNPYILMISTPNQPGGLMQTIEQEPNNSCLYHRIRLDYRTGLGKIFSQDDIDQAKRSPSFEREYDLQYLGSIGNVFSLTDIDKAIELGQQYQSLPVNPYTLHVGSVDWGYSSSLTALYVGEIDTENQILRIIHEEEFDRKTPSEIADRMFELYTQIPHLWWFVDGANRGSVNQAKAKFGESLEWDRAEDVSPETNCVIPVSFAKEHKQMLEHTYNLLTKQAIAIPAKYEHLITSLKTAYATEWNLDKELTVYDDSLDCLRMMCKGVKFDL